MVNQLKFIIEKNNKVIVVLFFAIILAIGLIIYKDYGVFWDEVPFRGFADVVLNYIFKVDQQLLQDLNRYHGQAYGASESSTD